MIEKFINSKNIRVGELVFILHTLKPMKTGWYRKVSESIKGGGYFYVFEKSIHPKFNEWDDSLSSSRKTRSIFHMGENTLRYNGQYVILARTTGISACYIMKNKYCIRECIDRLEELGDITITTDGLEILRKLDVLYDASHITQYDNYIEDIKNGLSNYKNQNK